MSEALPFSIPPLGARPASARTESFGFRSPRILSRLFDGILEEPRLEGGLNQGRDLTALVAELPASSLARLREYFGPPQFESLLQLQAESAPQLFYRSLLQIAGRMEMSGQEGAAYRTYRAVEDAAPGPELTGKAKARRLVLEGKGTFGDRSERVFRQMSREAGDYRNWVGLFAGAAAGSAFYNVLRRRVSLFLAHALEAKALHQGYRSYEAILALRFKTRVAAWAGASVGSVLAERGIRECLGPGLPWDVVSLAQDSAIAGMNLFAWRLSVGLSDSYRLWALKNSDPKRFLWKEVESFAFGQGLAAAGLGFALLAKDRFFDRRPQGGGDALVQVASTQAGMGLGRLLGRRMVLSFR